jgi:hypothetical protein
MGLNTYPATIALVGFVVAELATHTESREPYRADETDWESARNLTGSDAGCRSDGATPHFGRTSRDMAFAVGRDLIRVAPADDVARSIYRQLGLE